jgi:uncharacterized damage-inducible protein DinB
MISAQYAQTFARYNRWQNTSLITAADQLTPAQRQQNTGAFFGSFLGTLSHILWGDAAWMNRLTQTAFTPTPIDESGQLWTDWETYKQARYAMDERIIQWADQVSDDFFKNDLTYINAKGIQMTKPLDLVVMHIFNHQTHHRGQAHCLLTQFGAQTTATDILIYQESTTAL